MLVPLGDPPPQFSPLFFVFSLSKESIRCAPSGGRGWASHSSPGPLQELAAFEDPAAPLRAKFTTAVATTCKVVSSRPQCRAANHLDFFAA